MPASLQLANGLVIADASGIAKGKFSQFAWEWYDGVVTDSGRVEPVDFAITVAMNSRAGAARMKNFMAHQGRLEHLLKAVPMDVCLSSRTSGPVLAAVAELFAEACAAEGTALSVASKVLHRKRPLLIPMLDRVVVDRHYWPALSGPRPPSWFDKMWLKHGAWSDPTQYMRVMAEELDANRDALDLIRAELAAVGVPPVASHVRILEATLFAYLVGIPPVP